MIKKYSKSNENKEDFYYTDLDIQSPEQLRTIYNEMESLAGRETSQWQSFI